MCARALAVLTDDKDNKTVWDALPLINKMLENPLLDGAAAEDEGGEEEEDDDEDSDDSDDDDEEEEDEEGGGEDAGEDVVEEEEVIEEEVAIAGADYGSVAQMTAAAADMGLDAVPDDEHGKDAMLREDIRSLVESLVEDEATQEYR